ncbi:hypothetical protein MRB53_020139 [Persea americana]|uniref:Uncharacterized protein n=1 Tax=Persea americana TaxID=3435 RepID=A0ACC2L022_PERAE|nr:hypothetical protein MRB53_020139 [Persea americana]
MARELFDDMPQRDVVSWSTIIGGCVQVGCFMEAMELFHEMQLAGAMPNEFTLASALAAYANLVALDQGRWIHVYIEKAGIMINERLLASLIDIWEKLVGSEGSFEINVWQELQNLTADIISRTAGDADIRAPKRTS